MRPPLHSSPRLTFRAKQALRGKLALGRLREYLEFDAPLLRLPLVLVLVLLGFVLRAAGRKKKALALWASVHRANSSRLAARIVEACVRPGPDTTPVYEQYVAETPRTPATTRFFDDPCRLLGTRYLVLKSPRPNEKGVIVLDYSFTFPLFAKFFDVRRIVRDYHLVLEPSWSGYCDLDILLFTTLDCPVFVQSIEPRDTAFLEGLGSNLVPVPVAANWWVDHRVFRPLPGVAKDVDLLMVASWARFKRHDRFFAALARLKGRGQRLTALLAGYPAGCTRQEVEQLARYHGVDSQVEFHEWLRPEQLNRQMNRAKVNVLWSRKEGVNRAIIEGMFTGLPCLLREGFNYGHKYVHINPATGCYAREHELPDRLRWMVEHHRDFSPRDWVLANMTCQKATELLAESVRRVALARGEAWTEGLAVKVTQLNAMRYWNEADAERFRGDYEFLRAALRSPAEVPAPAVAR
jgi:glycosyltransferase involved in cell wall biosynthesis